MQIRDLQPEDTVAIEQAAHALVAGFREQAPDAWPDLVEARFVIVGVVPDANGYGKPDILLAKRVADS